MKISVNLRNCTFISRLFCQGSELAVEPTGLCAFQELAVCAALVINSLAPTQHNKHGGFVPPAVVWKFLVFLGVAHSTVQRKRGRRDATERKGRREEEHSMVRGFLKGILSPSRHPQLKEGLCDCIGVAT